MMVIECSQCKSENIWLQSYEDGGGDYGESITPWYECGDCGNTFSQDEAYILYVKGEEEQ